MAIDSLLEKVQIELKETDACTRKMEAKYSADLVDAAFKDAVKEAGKYAQLPGFRKGKAPASLIMSKYKDYILDDVAKVLQQGAFRKLTGDKELDIVSFGQVIAENKPETGKDRHAGGPQRDVSEDRPEPPAEAEEGRDQADGEGLKRKGNGRRHGNPGTDGQQRDAEGRIGKIPGGKPGPCENRR